MTLGSDPVLAVQTKSVQVILLVDVSGSMVTGAKIQSLNAALEEALPFLRRSVSELVGVEASVRVLTFGNSAIWETDEPIQLEKFWWKELTAIEGALTELGHAIELVLTSIENDAHELPPALILLADGMPTDTHAPSYADAMSRLDAHPVGGATSRIAVAVGSDADQDSLAAFVAKSGGQVLDARNPEKLAQLIRVAASSVLHRASEPIW